MKLKNIFASLVSTLAVLSFFTSCQEEFEPTYLDEIQVSSSYVALPAAGGSQTITLTATDSWSIQEISSWLTVSPTSGGAGETTVTFTAEATESTQLDTLYINCAGQQQLINVIQMTEKVELPISTVAEVIAAGSGTFRVRGTCTAISNTNYGNWYLEDETGEIYIYGTLDATGKEQNFLSLGIEVGDVVTVEGPYSLYGTTHELVDVTVINIEKSLISLAQAPDTIALEGGESVAKLIVKGEGVRVDIPESAKSWLSVTGINETSDTTLVTFYAPLNSLGDRSTDVTFVTTSGGVEYTAVTTVFQKGSILERTAAEINAAEDGETIYRITGMVSEIANTTYGNYYIVDYTGSVYVYGTLDAEGNTRNFSSLGINEGDIVTVTGPKTSYNGNPQMANVTVEVHQPVTTVSVAEFLAAAEDDTWYRLTGTVSNLANTTYGNFDIVDETGSVYVYGLVAGWGGPSRQFESLGITEGNTLTLIGQRTSYRDTPQVGDAFYVSHSTASSGGGEGGEAPTDYSIGLAYTLGSSAYDDGAATINGVEVDKVIKIGTGSKTGDFTVTVPAGSKSISFYAVAWKGKATTVYFYNGETSLGSAALAANDGATGNAPYTITVTSSDYYTLPCEVSEDTQIKICTEDASNGRAIFFGISAK